MQVVVRNTFIENHIFVGGEQEGDDLKTSLQRSTSWPRMNNALTDPQSSDLGDGKQDSLAGWKDCVTPATLSLQSSSGDSESGDDNASFSFDDGSSNKTTSPRDSTGGECTDAPPGLALPGLGNSAPHLASLRLPPEKFVHPGCLGRNLGVGTEADENWGDWGEPSTPKGPSTTYTPTRGDQEEIVKEAPMGWNEPTTTLETLSVETNSVDYDGDTGSLTLDTASINTGSPRSVTGEWAQTPSNFSGSPTLWPTQEDSMPVHFHLPTMDHCSTMAGIAGDCGTAPMVPNLRHAHLMTFLPTGGFTVIPSQLEPTTCPPSLMIPPTGGTTMSGPPLTGMIPTGTMMSGPLTLTGGATMPARTPLKANASMFVAQQKGPSPSTPANNADLGVLQTLLAIAGGPSSPVAQFTSVVGRVCMATAGMPHLVVHMPVGDSKEMVLSANGDSVFFDVLKVVKESLRAACAESETIYLRGFRNESTIFQPSATGEGVEAVCSFIPPEDLNMACWDIQNHGFCPRASKNKCRWHHPKETLTFRVKLGMS